MITHEILGDDMQAVVLTLGGGDVVRAEAGALMFMTDQVEMDARMDGGLLGGLKRKFLAGESLFITYFKSLGAGARVAFAGPYPGKIIHVALAGQTLLCQRDAFLCATGSIDLSIAFTKRLGAGFFGGEGFILQKLGGTCQAWVELDGEVRVLDLQPGELLRVNPGHVGMFQAQMAFDVQMMPGIKNKLFGGEGLFLATLTGPGRVWLQTLPIANLAHALEPYLPQPSGDDDSSGVKIVGNLLGGN